MRRRSWRRVLGRLALVLALIVLLGWAVFEAVVTQVGWQVQREIGDPELYRPPASAMVYDTNQNLIDSFAAERRIWKPIEELPRHVWMAFVAAEDRKFFEHSGIDPSAIARAAIANWKAGHITEGGSTITQQLAKNLVTGGDRTYARKLHEALIAHWLERTMTKAEILELYLNYVYLGAGSFGVEAAARQYFNRSASELDPGQAAMLAGVIPAPSRYNPEADPALAAAQRSRVLAAMVEIGALTREQADRYRDDPVRIVPEARPVSRVGDAYRTQVRRELRRLFGADRVFQRGLKVVTPYNPAIQAVAEHAVREAVAALQARQGLGGPIAAVDRDYWDGWLAAGEGLPRSLDARLLPPAPGDCFKALVGEGGLDDLRAGSWRYALARSDRGLRVRALHPGEQGTGPVAARARPGHVVRVCLPADAEATEDGPLVVRWDQSPWGEAAVVVLENATGNVVALVGGRQDVLEDFVRATQARRQPGSTFKAFVYAAVLAEGGSQLDTVLDAPLAMPGGNGRIWAPKNYDGGYRGAMPLRVALALSRNVPSVRLALKVGPERVAEIARAMGVRSPLRADLTLALGSSEVTPMDQAIGFATIARMGSRPDPVYLLEVRDMEDRLLGRAGDVVNLQGGRPVELPGGPGEQVLDPGVAYELSDMLRAVVERGTGRRGWRPDHVRIGKTGTTNDATDTWFAGATPDYTIAVWVGTDRPESLGARETGSAAALPAWAIIADALPPPSRPDFPIPPEGVRIPWQDGWVGVARSHVPDRFLRRPAVAEGPLPSFPAPRPDTAGDHVAATGGEATP